jgi:hypothetical protein
MIEISNQDRNKTKKKYLIVYGHFHTNQDYSDRLVKYKPKQQLLIKVMLTNTVLKLSLNALIQRE